MSNEPNKPSNDKNPERHFFTDIDAKNDITHILAQQRIEEIQKGDTTPDKNAIVELYLTKKQIEENIKDIDNYLDFIRLVTGSPSYAPELTNIIDKNYTGRQKTHNDITERMGIQDIQTTDTMMLPHIQNILRNQQHMIHEIEQELPKAQKLVKSTNLEFAEHQKVFNTLQQTAEYIMLRGALIKEFGKTNKNDIHPEDRGIFEMLNSKADSIGQEADQIQSEICTFLGEWAAVEKPSDVIYNNYKTLRRKANKFEAETSDMYQLMLKYENQ